MTVDSVTSFVDCLRRANLLTAEQLSETAGQLHRRFPEPRALAGELLRRGWLTPYQANQLLAGRGPELVLGSYIVLERLGEGGMGQVFKARHQKLGTIVALKVIRKDRLGNPDAVRRFQREVQAGARLGHPNIVQSLDADQAGDLHFLVMEYIDGIDLARVVKQRGPLPVETACDFIRQAALGLQHAHERNLVHRDIKPSNLLVSGRVVSGKEGTAPPPLATPLTTHHSPLTTHQVKIADLGLARLRHTPGEDSPSHGLTRDGSVIGTLDYVAPEQATDSHGVDVRADLYSLGCTFYFLLTAKVPFPGGEVLEKLYRHKFEEPTPVEKLRPEVPAAVAGIIRKLMAKRPEDRYQTAAEVAAELASILKQRAARSRRSGAEAGEFVIATVSVVEGGPTVPLPAAAKRSRMRRLQLAAAGLLLVVLAGVLFLALGRGSSNPSGTLAVIPGSRTASRAGPRPTDKGQIDPGRPALRELRRFTGHTKQVGTVALSPDGRQALSAGEDLIARLWAIDNVRDIQQLHGHGNPILAAAISPDGARALTAGGQWNGSDYTIRLFDLGTGSELKRFSGHEQLVSRVYFSRDGRKAYSTSWDSTVRSWDIESGKPLQALTVFPKAWITCLAMIGDGSTALAGCQDQTLRLCDLQAMRQVRTIKTGHSDRLLDVAVAPDGQLAASAGMDRTIRLWNIEGGNEIRTITGHEGAVNSVCFASNGKWLYSASADRTIRLWDVPSGKELARGTGHTDAVRRIIVSADERRLLSAGNDGTVRVWEVK
jgi:serine/threonine protein kinase